jgi:hypothetical protein
MFFSPPEALSRAFFAQRSGPRLSAGEKVKRTPRRFTGVLVVTALRPWTGVLCVSLIHARAFAER